MATTLTYFTVTGDWRNVTDSPLQGTTNSASVEVVSALVDFIPRVPDGFVTYMDDYTLSINANEVQVVTIEGSPTSGTFTLNVAGVTTTDIAYNAAASAVQSALQALSSVGSGNAVVSGSAGGPWTVTFQGTLANTPIGQMIATPDFSGGVAPDVDVETTTEGSAAATRDTGIVLPTRHGRIWEGRLATINVNDTPDMKLVANSADLNLQLHGITSLIYDVSFSNATFADGDRRLKNFGFTAPVGATTVCLTDPALPRLEYNPY